MAPLNPKTSNITYYLSKESQSSSPSSLKESSLLRKNVHVSSHTVQRSVPKITGRRGVKSRAGPMMGQRGQAPWQAVDGVEGEAWGFVAPMMNPGTSLGAWSSAHTGKTELLALGRGETAGDSVP